MLANNQYLYIALSTEIVQSYEVDNKYIFFSTICGIKKVDGTYSGYVKEF